MATNGTILGVFAGVSLAAAFTNPQALDLIQVKNEGANAVYKLTSTGVGSTNPSSVTGKALIGHYIGSSLAAAFTNPNNLDLLQVVNEGGNVAFHVDYLGVGHTP